MKKKLRKLRNPAIVLTLLAAGMWGYTSNFSPATSPEQLEYLPVSETQAATHGFISSAIAKEPDAQIQQLTPGQPRQPGQADILFDFSQETVGAPPKTFAAAVGNWVIGTEDTNTFLVVDGRKWKRGVASAGIADKARALYGERYAEFLDNVTAYAYFPFAVAQNVDSFSNGEISVRFKGVAGRIDQGAGILFDLKPNGDYYTVRANPLENNLVLWRLKQGRRSSVAWVRNVTTPSHKWHTMKVTVKDNMVKGYVNGKQYLAYRLPAKVSGKVGLWTKADSVIYFDDYRVISK